MFQTLKTKKKGKAELRYKKVGGGEGEQGRGRR